MDAIEPSDKTIFVLPIGYGVVVFGLVSFTIGTFGPMIGANVERGFQFAIFAGVVIGFLHYHELAKAYKARWHKANDMLIARLRRDTAHYEAEAESYGQALTTEDDDVAGTTANDDDANRLRVNTANGSYSMSRMSEAERREMAEVGECLRFVAIGRKAKKFSLRAMLPHRPAGWSETRFEKWWTERGNRLVAWKLFEKVDRSTTKPAGGRSPEDVRRALLHREFQTTEQTAVLPAQTGQGQTA